VRLGSTNFATSQNVVKLLVLAATQSVVLFTVEVLLEVGLEPLAELEVVEVLGLHELGNVNVPLYAVLVEGVLEDLVVLDELVLVFGAPLDSREGEGAGVEGVQDGAVDGPSGTLLNLGQLQLKRADGSWTRGSGPRTYLKEAVEPVEDVDLAHEVGLVHHANRL
jgi:hypothetical protein